MKNSFFILIFIISSAAFISGSIKNLSAQKIINFKIDDFEEVVELTGEKLNIKNSLMNPIEIILFDSLLFLKNDITNPSVDVISLNSGETISSFCKRGRGPGELVSPFCIQFVETGKEIMVQDFAAKKVVFYDLNLILSNASQKYTHSVSFSDSVRVRKVALIEGGIFFCNLLGHEDGYMNCILNSDGELVRFLDKYPKVDVPFNPIVGANIFGPRIGTFPSLDKIIMPYMHSDLISIYSSSGNKIIEFKGPYYKELDLIYKNGRTSLTSQNNCTYNLPCANNKSFMIPYDGTKYKYAHSPAYHIFHFDFDGSLLQHFKLDQSVTNIAVDWENRIIYGINKDLEPCIYKFKF